MAPSCPAAHQHQVGQCALPCRKPLWRSRVLRCQGPSGRRAAPGIGVHCKQLLCRLQALDVVPRASCWAISDILRISSNICITLSGRWLGEVMNDTKRDPSYRASSHPF